MQRNITVYITGQGRPVSQAVRELTADLQPLALAPKYTGINRCVSNRSSAVASFR